MVFRVYPFPQALRVRRVEECLRGQANFGIACSVSGSHTTIIHTKENQHMAHEPVKSVEEKFSIVVEGLKENVNISDLCRRHSISQTSFYKWRDRFLEGGKTALASNGTTSAAIEAEKIKIAELERVIGQQAVEVQVLKKKLKLL
jgi:transposase-like protein